MKEHADRAPTNSTGVPFNGRFETTPTCKQSPCSLWPVESQANVASRATLGLKLLYATVGAASRRKRARPLATDAESWSPDGGVLDGGGGAAGASKVRGGEGGGLLSSTSRVSWASFEELPLLGHRYRYLSRISKGTFADVIRCACVRTRSARGVGGCTSWAQY